MIGIAIGLAALAFMLASGAQKEQQGKGSGGGGGTGPSPYEQPPIPAPMPNPPPPPPPGPTGGRVYNRTEAGPVGPQFPVLDAGAMLNTLSTYLIEYQGNDPGGYMLFLATPTGEQVPGPVDPASLVHQNAGIMCVQVAANGGAAYAPIGVELPGAETVALKFSATLEPPPAGYAVLAPTA